MLTVKRAFRQILELPERKSLAQARQLRQILKELAEGEFEAGFQVAIENAGDWLEPSDYWGDMD